VEQLMYVVGSLMEVEERYRVVEAEAPVGLLKLNVVMVE
jgi:hypothetical protein